MDNFEKVVGLPDKNLEVTYEADKIYGLAYINHLTKRWICNAGTLPYLMGLYQSFIGLDEFLPETKKNFMATVFFNLDDNLQPIEVINHFNVDKHFVFQTTGVRSEHGSQIRDLSILAGNRIPKLEFEV